MHLEYKNILVYKNYQDEECPIDISSFKGDEVYVSCFFDQSLSYIVGEAKVFLGPLCLLADIIIYGEYISKGDQPAEDKIIQPLFTKEQIELLIPCIGGKILKRTETVAVGDLVTYADGRPGRVVFNNH